ncbi:hypothetical protein BDV34DRAFT_215631 [Aspergillus parasiticus]|uniref:Tetratricopeptide repeat n=1 Tax=Aspergillus parasiticus TaxID=5067 RepID=A0A5N6DB34_ASPPA|nr:hypothetical protein BDV34DRAFT_215631 [Aspergillus parasiticus]
MSFPSSRCNYLLQHVLTLKDNFKEERRHTKDFRASSQFCELLQDYVCEVNLLAVETLENRELATDIAASTLSHQANMYESIGKVHKAIELNTKGYNMRLGEKPSRDTWIAWNVNQGREADWPTVTKNMARCFLEKPFNWAMLAYAYFTLRTLERYENRLEAAEASCLEAQNLWSKGDQTKLHPFNAACLYKTGVVCLDQGNVEAAIKHIRDTVEITKFHANVMPVGQARGLFKLSEALLQDSCDSEKVKALRDEAELYLLRRDPQAVDFGREEDYDQWVPIFWR